MFNGILVLITSFLYAPAVIAEGTFLLSLCVKFLKYCVTIMFIHMLYLKKNNLMDFDGA